MHEADLRIQAILQIKLDGAEPWDIRQYVSEKEQADEAPWKMGPSKKPLSERQIRRYMAEADKRIGEVFVTSNAEGIAHHVLKRRSLYARAVQAGELRTALAILIDLAELDRAGTSLFSRCSGSVSSISIPSW